jgi:hypothetical protein
MLVAGCREPPPAPAVYALPSGAVIALNVAVREELTRLGAARRIELALNGPFAQDGVVHLTIVGGRFESRDGDGHVDVVSTDMTASDLAPTTDVARTAARLLESLRGAAIDLHLDATRGLDAGRVDGLDRALDRIVRDEPTLAEMRDGMRAICSDDAWRRALAAAGLCATPQALRGGGSADRIAIVRAPGRGVTSMSMRGARAADVGGLPTVHVAGKLAPDAVFESPDAPPPDAVGAVDVASVTGDAITSYPPGAGPPAKGEFTLRVPFAGGEVVRTTTTFTLVRK